MKKGFTLVEILVVIAILGIMGLVVTEIFIRNLRGNEKARILANIKQNGQVLLDKMDKIVRGADNIVCVPSSDVLVVAREGVYTRYRFKAESGVTTIVEDNPVFSGNGPLSTFVGDICSVNDYPGTSKTVLTDSRVSIIDYRFSKDSPLAGYKDTVSIIFKLTPTALNEAVIVDSVEFQTSIGLR